MRCEAGRCNKTSTCDTITKRVEGCPTKAKEAPSPHEVILIVLL